MSRKKSLYTVREAVEMAFGHMQDEFYANTLLAMTRALTARPHLRDDTILRRLREAREDQPEKYGYICKDHERSIYKKQALKKAELV